ncbi:MAG: hypothetical protein O7D32_07405 [bacterium]|nr:hypothetical protein [bacterium]
MATRHYRTIICLCLGFIVLVAHDLSARQAISKKEKDGFDGPQRAVVLDGSTVHNVGALQMHLFNWGEWGSHPGTAQPYSYAPSAQWPGGSGIEYLFAAGLWIGAIKSGVPAVSTAAFEREFRPSPDRRDILYRSEEGSKGGDRIPSIDADDDGDGRIDEDRLDGYDNDGDGLVDEDYGAIGRAMYSCRYTDFESVSTRIYPEHNPLNLAITQESYQWGATRLDNVISIELRITNVGDDVLQDVYIGMYVDGDVGPLEKDHYWEDDMAARQRVDVLCTDLGPGQIDIAYMYDEDGDDGQTPGRFGVTFLNYTTDPTGLSAPSRVGLASFAHFSGRQVFAFGGDPTNDFERYEVLSQNSYDDASTQPRDYRFLMSAGPFLEWFPDSTIVVQMAFAIGASESELVNNAASAQAVYRGLWFDVDNDPTTGAEGRETPIYGPRASVWKDECRRLVRIPTDREGCDTGRIYEDRFVGEVRQLQEGEVVWSNVDCDVECLYKSACGYDEADSLLFRTGVGGRESQVHWLTHAAPPPPNIRVDDHAKDGVVIYWDNISELVPAVSSFVEDISQFEGYQFWRADDWARPVGTSTLTGPPRELWSIFFQADLVNNFGEDTGLDRFRYEPLTHLLPVSQKTEFITAIQQHLIEFPADEPPCPQGVTPDLCDTLKALARWGLGRDGGRQYYRYADKSVIEGVPYFYSVVAFDHTIFGRRGEFRPGIAGSPASNFVFVEPKSPAQADWAYDENRIYVVPNPVTRETMAEWTLGPTNDDPTGTKIEFRNLPGATGVIRVFTLAGDLVIALPFDATNGVGTVAWDLVSRNGQDIVSGVYLYAIEFTGPAYPRVIKKFTVIR